jgi:Family of unknown function (DUF6165)
MLIEISEGEALDRLSILEIKNNRINNPLQLVEIQKEIISLSSIFLLKQKYILYYKLLIYVNTIIWDKTNIVKESNYLDSNYSQNAYDIFEYNQQRFRIKNIINYSENSNLKEQKSYNKKYITYLITSTISIEKLLLYLSYLLISYDCVEIYENDYIIPYKDIIHNYLPSLSIVNYTENIITNDFDIIIPEVYQSELHYIISSIIY